MNTLSPKQFDALRAIFSKENGCSVLGLTREMKIETVLAKNLVRELLNLDMLTDCGNGNYRASPKGRDVLIAANVPGAERKKTGVPKGRQDQANLAKLEALDLPPSDQTLRALAEMTGESVVPDFYKAITEGQDQVTLNVRQSGVLSFEDGHAKFKPDAAQFAELPAPDRADFATLVRQGLARLNENLGRQPIEIKNAALKVEALNGLAEAFAGFDASIFVLLKDIAQDIQRASEK